MDIQKEREAFECWFRTTATYKTLWDFISTHQTNIKSVFVKRNGKTYQNDCVQVAWSAWQAAKAQAVPEGFVLVKKVHPDAIVHNQGLGLFKECQVIYGWDGKSKDFKEALNKGFYHGVKLGAKAVLETAMIEAQEPAK